MVRTTDTIVIGGGQAGLSLSYYLSRLGHRHVALERDRIGDQWLARRDISAGTRARSARLCTSAPACAE